MSINKITKYFGTLIFLIFAIFLFNSNVAYGVNCSDSSDARIRACGIACADGGGFIFAWQSKAFKTCSGSGPGSCKIGFGVEQNGSCVPNGSGGLGGSECHSDADCDGVSGPVCGNNACETGENINNCSADCTPPPPPSCTYNPGDGTCCGSAGEQYGNSGGDCPATCSNIPNDGICCSDHGEVQSVTNADCGGCAADGTCSSSGSCGSANNVAVVSKPTTNLCSSGTASQVTGSGPWNWTCFGQYNGANASCSAPVAPHNLTSCITDVCTNQTYGGYFYYVEKNQMISTYCLSEYDNYQGVTCSNPQSPTDIPTYVIDSVKYWRRQPGKDSGTCLNLRDPVPSCVPSMSGTLTPASPTCTISSGASSCNVTISWTTTSPQGTSAITSSYPSSNTHVVTDANNGTNVSVNIPYASSPRNLYLYNNAVLLAQNTATATCVSGTSWDGSKCAANNSAPIGNVDNADCSTIWGWTYDSDTSASSIAIHVYKEGNVFIAGYAANTSRPDVNSYFGITGNHGFNFPTPDSLKDGVAHTIHIYAIDSAGAGPNPEISGSPRTITCVPPMSGTLTPPSPTCTILSGASSCNVNLTWTTTNPVGTSAITAVGMTNVNGNNGGPTAFTVPYPNRTFNLYNNGFLLAQSNAVASCASGTHWNGSLCEVNSGTTISANPTTIVSGASTTLTWSGTGTCTGTNFNTGGANNGSVSVSPTHTTTYAVSCTTSGNASVTVIVKKKPVFIEN